MPHETSFLFVNKFPVAGQKQRPVPTDEKSKIQRFVQKGWRKDKKRRLPSAFQLTSTKSPCLDRACIIKEEVDSAYDSASVLLTPCSYDVESQSSPHDKFGYVCGQPRVIEFDACSPLRTCQPRGSSKDPFDVIPIQIDRDSRYLIDYYESVTDPPLWLWRIDSQGQNDSDKAVNNVIQEAYKDDLAMSCVLAISAALLHHPGGLLHGKGPDKQNEYIGQALQLMQQRIKQAIISKEVDCFYLVRYMLMLSAAEAHRGNAFAARKHFKASLDLLAGHSKTMIDVPRDNLQGLMVLVDQHFGCLDLRRCLYQYEVVTTAQLSLKPNEIHATTPDLLQMGSALLECTLAPPSMLSDVLQIKETYLIKRSINMSVMSAARFKEVILWIRARYRYVRGSLLSTFATSYSQLGPLEMDKLSSRDLAETAVRIALILFTFLSIRDKKSVIFGEPLSQQLRRYLNVLMQRQNDGSKALPCVNTWIDITLWMLVMGLSCSTDGGETEAWFEQAAGKLMGSILDLDGDARKEDVVRQMEQSLSMYFYDVQGQGQYLERLVRNALSGRPDVGHCAEE